MIKNSDLKVPFAHGEEIVIPKGVLVRSFNPSRKSYVTKRRQTVKLHRADDGWSQRIVYMGDKERRRSPEHAEAFRRYDELLLDAATNPDEEEASRLRKEAYEMHVFINPPEVHWAGSGGYWCRAPLQDVVGENFREPKSETKH